MGMASGKRLGPYEIISHLGAGGMGEVYLARDGKLDRQVAIKVLPPDVVRDPERIARFEREARVLASLNHPNIAGVYGFDESDGARFLVMEYVEGETLSAILKRGALAIDDALDIARQMAEGLEEAHERGIVHRDLKPGNVMVTPEGKVKILDFGLAKALTDDSSVVSDANSPTITANFTRPGVILGTAAYMSPEQARGRAVDKRSDIWSFGVVLYEMLTGDSPFRGDTVTDSVGAILHKELDFDALPGALDAACRRVLARCLERDRRSRLRDIGDARIELESRSEPAMPTATTHRTRPVSPTLAFVLLIGIALGAVITAAGWPRQAKDQPHARSAGVLRAAIELPDDHVLTSRLTVSPEGDTIVIAAAGVDGVPRLFQRSLDSFEFVELANTEGARFPFFSPDGQWVGFSSRGRLRKVRLSGGSPLTLCSGSVMGAYWLEDGRIIYGEFGSGLRVVDDDGGEPRTLTTLNTARGEVSHVHPIVLPDGDTVLFTVGTGSGSQIGTVSLERGEVSDVRIEGGNPRPLFDNVVAYFRDGQICTASYHDTPKPMFRGIVPRTKGVGSANWGGAVFAQYDVGRNGSLIYSSETTEVEQSAVALVDMKGNERLLKLPPGKYLFPSVSPDGTHLALTRIEDDSGIGDIWIVDIERETASRLSVEGTNYTPVWSPDGETVTYVSNGNLVNKRADGSGAATTLRDVNAYERPLSWNSDATALVFEVTSSGRTDIYLLQHGSDATPLLVTPFNERSVSFSPDDSMIAYVSNETGIDEVYVAEFPGPGARLMVSSGGGVEPRWSRDGTKLYYRSGDRFLSAPIERSPRAFVGDPEVLFEARYFSQGIVWNYDVLPEDRGFVTIKSLGPRGGAALRVVTGWLNTTTAANEN